MRCWTLWMSGWVGGWVGEMFKAKIFKPPRLCAVFAIEGRWVGG